MAGTATSTRRAGQALSPLLPATVPPPRDAGSSAVLATSNSKLNSKSGLEFEPQPSHSAQSAASTLLRLSASSPALPSTSAEQFGIATATADTAQRLAANNRRKGEAATAAPQLEPTRCGSNPTRKSPRNHAARQRRGRPETGTGTRTDPLAADRQAISSTTTSRPRPSDEMDGARAMPAKLDRDRNCEGSEAVAVQLLDRPKPRTLSAAREALKSTASATKTRPRRGAPIAGAERLKQAKPRMGNDDTAKRDAVADHTRQRQKQNRVGKRYRDRLVAGFDALHAALHIMQAGHGDVKNGHQNGHQNGHGPLSKQEAKSRRRPRVVNKTKVVELARERVLTLVREWDAVRAERDALLRERILGAW